MLRITFDTAQSDGHYVYVLKLEGELAVSFASNPTLSAA
jgi:hypothetical protein